jgi:hypothetical protein
MSNEFKLNFLIAFFALTFSLVLVLYFSKGDLWVWIRYVWWYALMVVSGLDFGLVLYMGWDYMNPKESRLPVYLGLAASMIVGWAYKGIALLVHVL